MVAASPARRGRPERIGFALTLRSGASDFSMAEPATRVSAGAAARRARSASQTLASAQFASRDEN